MKNTKTSFSTVGDSVLSYVGNGTCKQPLRGSLEAKQTMGRGRSPIGSSAIRGNTQIHEAMGPKCCVVATLYKPNAAESSATERNVRIMPSAVGVGDFWKARTVTGQNAY